jgi:hypothetical protein
MNAEQANARTAQTLIVPAVATTPKESSTMNPSDDYRAIVESAGGVFLRVERGCVYLSDDRSGDPVISLYCFAVSRTRVSPSLDSSRCIPPKNKQGGGIPGNHSLLSVSL